MDKDSIRKYVRPQKNMGIGILLVLLPILMQHMALDQQSTVLINFDSFEFHVSIFFHPIIN